MDWRIIVVGTSGAGKTTLARELGRRLNLPHVELDEIHWGTNWTPCPTDLFRERVASALDGPQWVADGGYRKVRDVLWSRASVLVWLDYPFPLVMGRLLKRTLLRWLRREELYNGNRESLWEHLCTRDSLLLYAMKTHRSRRRMYESELKLPEYAHLTVYRFTSPRETQRWVDSLSVVPLPMEGESLQR